MIAWNIGIMECKGIESNGKEDDKRGFLKRSREKQVLSFVMSFEKSGLMITRGLVSWHF